MYAALVVTERTHIRVNEWLDRNGFWVAVLSCVAVTVTILRPF
jgi:hypothetical protein